MEEAAGRSTPDLFNLIVASGYVAEDADFTFHENRADGYPLNKYVFQHPPAGGGRIKKARHLARFSSLDFLPNHNLHGNPTKFQTCRAVVCYPHPDFLILRMSCSSPLQGEGTHWLQK
ncbi:MAG: hypothetical protein ACFN9G_06160 [Cardiobacterium sp.]